MALTKILIIGGARSGKSEFALMKATEIQGMKAFIATAEVLDNEMKKRVETHKRHRGPGWRTFEEPLHVAAVLKDIIPYYDVIILDCLTLWLSNVMSTEQEPQEHINALTKALESFNVSTHPVSLFMVSNEVGMGIVPDNELARQFRDLSGAMNKLIAQVSDEVYFVSAGIPLKLK
jgi:adenosylcobinamide kinase/adenosylcobinamide-phosphate guanylyltransferase